MVISFVQHVQKYHRVPQDVKVDILRRVKEEDIPASQAAKDAGITETTIYDWLGKGATGGFPPGRSSPASRSRTRSFSRWCLERQSHENLLCPQDAAIRICRETGCVIEKYLCNKCLNFQCSIDAQTINNNQRCFGAQGYDILLGLYGEPAGFFSSLLELFFPEEAPLDLPPAMPEDMGTSTPR